MHYTLYQKILLKAYFTYLLTVSAIFKDYFENDNDTNISQRNMETVMYTFLTFLQFLIMKKELTVEISVLKYLSYS